MMPATVEDDARERNDTGDYGEASTPRQHERIQKASDDQEKQLDALYNGAVRLKGAAIATNEEVQAQSQIIDEISIQIDTTQQEVQQQTAVAKKVAKSHKTLFAWYVIIFLELVGLIIVLVI